VLTLKHTVQSGRYVVDPGLVADAIVGRLLAARGAAAARETARPQTETQNECSYPESSPSASVKTTPGGPSTTDPTQLSVSIASTGC